jgi:hypothetical protein
MIPRGWIISHLFWLCGLLVIDAVAWWSMYFAVMPRVNLIVILLTYACYLYSINCPTIICLPTMLLFILWRDTTSELWTPVQFPLHFYHLFTLLALFNFLHTTIAFHSIHSFLCLQQTDDIDNLIVSWEQSTGLCCVLLFATNGVIYCLHYTLCLMAYALFTLQRHMLCLHYTLCLM